MEWDRPPAGIPHSYMLVRNTSTKEQEDARYYCREVKVSWATSMMRLPVIEAEVGSRHKAINGGWQEIVGKRELRGKCKRHSAKILYPGRRPSVNASGRKKTPAIYLTDPSCSRLLSLIMESFLIDQPSSFIPTAPWPHSQPSSSRTTGR